MTWDFLHRWYMPFAWITVSSVVAVPLAVYSEAGMQLRPGGELGLAYGSGWVMRDDLLASMIPYLLNLGAGIWLFNADGSTRWAAFWALLVAGMRIIAPVWIATMSDVSVAGQHYVDWHTLRVLLWFQDFEMFAFGFMVWGIFARFVGSAPSAPSAAHSYVEA